MPQSESPLSIAPRMILALLDCLQVQSVSRHLLNAVRCGPGGFTTPSLEVRVWLLQVPVLLCCSFSRLACLLHASDTLCCSCLTENWALNEKNVERQLAHIRCEDTNNHCEDWVKRGECINNPSYLVCTLGAAATL